VRSLGRVGHRGVRWLSARGVFLAPLYCWHRREI
jgi:hypothetical protein